MIELTLAKPTTYLVSNQAVPALYNKEIKSHKWNPNVF